MDRIDWSHARLIWTIVFCAPVIAFVAGRASGRWWPRGSSAITIAALLVVVAWLFAGWLRFSFTNAWANDACVVLALLAFWLLTASAVRIIKYRAVRYPVLLAAVIVGALVSFGTTIAYFESAFPPERTEIMATDLTCEITGWGSAGSSSGYTVHLYKLWPGVRLIKKEVVTFSVVQAGFVGDPPADRTCAHALETYRRSS